MQNLENSHLTVIMCLFIKTEQENRFASAKLSNEILSLISNRGSLTDDELLIKVIGMIRKSRFFQGKLAGYLNRDKRMDKA